MINVDDLAKNLAKKLRIERAKRHMSQEKLAEIAQLHRTTISAIECERFFPTIDNVVRIANAFDISMNEFFDFNF